jgi:hypothetical protein
MLFVFLGIPQFWHRIIAMITGIIIVSIAYNLPHEKRTGSTEIKDSVYTENNNISNS